MCFVGNHGMIQIHSGPVANIQPMGPWLNIMDPTFHLHLRTDHSPRSGPCASRRPMAMSPRSKRSTPKGEMVIQFFGKRKEGFAERAGMARNHGRPRPPRHHRGSLKELAMKTPYDFRRLRSWELALALFAVSTPFVLPLASPPSFVRAAVAQEMQKADTSRARLGRRCHYRDRLCARRRGQAGRARFDQRLSRCGNQAA